MVDFYQFVDFTGEETEKEFLEKCIQQWDMTMESEKNHINKMLEIASVFREIRHRLVEL